MIRYIKNFLKSLPYLNLTRNILRNVTGHFYSPLPSFQEIKRKKAEIFRKGTPSAVDLNFESQLEKLKLFSEMQEGIPFYHEQKRIRFNIDNMSFSYDDAPILHYMMRLLQPSKIIEIGSGHSSACMLDTNELYLDGKVKFTFIDISLNDIRKMLRDGDLDKVTLLEKRIQDIDLRIFETLEANDILFIDSSHVMKIGSDLSAIFFDIMPRLRPGVYIHFHDIRYPFQYPETDIEQRIFWNEAYVLHAFLQYNDSFKIIFWLNFLLNTHNPAVKELISFLPLNDWAKKFSHNKMASEDDGNKYTDAGGVFG